MLPHKSVAVQVLVMIESPTQVPFDVLSVIVTVAILQLSVAVNVAAVGTEPHATVVAAGTVSTKVGATVSLTVIVCTCVAVFPQRSVAVQVLVITYEEGHDPFAVVSDMATVAVPQLSVAVSAAAAGTASHEAVALAGNVPAKAGAVVSLTVMFCTCVAVFPQRSVAVQVLVRI